jgi:hypothetical protein
MFQRKPIMTPLPPANVMIGADGTMVIDHPVDLLGQIRLRGAHGITATVAACLMFGCDKPTRNERVKAQRKLAKMAADGLLHERPGSKGGGADRSETTWFARALEAVA